MNEIDGPGLCKIKLSGVFKSTKNTPLQGEAIEHPPLNWWMLCAH